MKINIFRGISSYYNIIYSKFRISLKIIDEDKIYLWGITLKHTIMNTTEMEGNGIRLKEMLNNNTVLPLMTIVLIAKEQWISS